MRFSLCPQCLVSDHPVTGAPALNAGAWLGSMRNLGAVSRPTASELLCLTIRQWLASVFVERSADRTCRALLFWLRRVISGRLLCRDFDMGVRRHKLVRDRDTLHDLDALCRQ